MGRGTWIQFGREMGKYIRDQDESHEKEGTNKNDGPTHLESQRPTEIFSIGER